MLNVFDQTSLSPEQVALRIGVSNMTYRRWRKAGPGNKVPRLYQMGIIDGVHQLIVEKKLDAERPEISSFLSRYTQTSLDAALSHLGFDKHELLSGTTDQDKLTGGLSKIGGRKSSQEYVNMFWGKLPHYKAFGEQWTKHLDQLSGIVKSPVIPHVDKLVALGALFYLFNPFDLIPDYIPVFGYLDDFAVIALACAYYGAKYVNSKKDNQKI